MLCLMSYGRGTFVEEEGNFTTVQRHMRTCETCQYSSFSGGSRSHTITLQRARRLNLVQGDSLTCWNPTGSLEQVVGR